MGQGESKDVKSTLPLSANENQNVRQLFYKICQGKVDSCSSVDKFKIYLKSHFPEWISENLFHAMLKVSADPHGKSTAKKDELTLHKFTVSVSHITRGMLSQKAEIVQCMASKNPAVTPRDIVNWTQEMLRAYIIIASKTSSYSSWSFDVNNYDGQKRVAFAITRDLFYEVKDKKRHQDNFPENKNFDSCMLEDWMSRSAIVLHIFDVVFNKIFPIHGEGASAHFALPVLPTSSRVDWTKTTSLLTQYDILLLNYNLPHELKTEWRLVFHTEAHGESFATFVKNICNKGPSIIIVKDKEDHVFGGFASQSWELNPNFVGSARCFLFSLRPHTEVYLASGLNENHMYLNSMQETLPNGLGMGGQFNYHGLYIDDEFGKGHSCAEPYCTTYDSPMLSGQRLFEIDTLEVWAVGPEPKQDEDESEQRSILDKDPEAKAMLQIINKGPLSEGLREGDPMAEQPEDSTFHT